MLQNAYVRWHSQHSNGRSFECVAKCSFSSDKRGKTLPQSSHLCIKRRRSIDPPPLVWMSCASVVVSSIFKSKNMFAKGKCVFWWRLEFYVWTHRPLDLGCGPPNVISRNFSIEICTKFKTFFLFPKGKKRARVKRKMAYDLSQSGHSYGSSPVCTDRCCLRDAFDRK